MMLYTDFKGFGLYSCFFTSLLLHVLYLEGLEWFGLIEVLGWQYVNRPQKCIL